MPLIRPPTAHPRTRDDLTLLPQCPDVLTAAIDRGISDVVHFTTIQGAVGVLASKALRAGAGYPASSTSSTCIARTSWTGGATRLARLCEPVNLEDQRLDVRHVREVAHCRRRLMGRAVVRAGHP